MYKSYGLKLETDVQYYIAVQPYLYNTYIFMYKMLILQKYYCLEKNTYEYKLEQRVFEIFAYKDLLFITCKPEIYFLKSFSGSIVLVNIFLFMHF